MARANLPWRRGRPDRSDLAKDIAGEPLLRGVSFKLERRDRMTIAGRNGAGKTTLLRMLAGETSVDGGELVLREGHARRAARPAPAARARPHAARLRAQRAAASRSSSRPSSARLEHAMAEGDDAGDRPLRRRLGALRGRRRLRLARPRATPSPRPRLRRRRPRPPARDLLRRPADARARWPARSPPSPTCCCSTSRRTTSTSSRSSGSSRRCVGLDAAIVLVAHDRWFLEAVGTAVLELEAGRSRFFNGTWHAVAQRAGGARDGARQGDRQAAGRDRAHGALRRALPLQGVEGAPGPVARQEARQDRAHRARPARRRARSASSSSRPSARAASSSSSRTGALEVGRAATLLDDAELWLERGEHVSLVGPNGTGKTTLIEALAGAPRLDGGKLRTRPQRQARLPLPARRGARVRRRAHGPRGGGQAHRA